jgi:hypothetical protein
VQSGESAGVRSGEHSEARGGLKTVLKPTGCAKLAAENTLVMSAAARTIIDFLMIDMALSLECMDTATSDGGQSSAGSPLGLETRLKRF